MTLQTKRILVLQHTEPEHLGLIAEVLTQKNIDYNYLRPDLGQPVPNNLDGYHGLVMMGGPQSVYEEDRFPFLRAEKTLTRQAIATNRPILGVCLGSQILAEVLGSQVQPGGTFELGWKKVTISRDIADDPVLGHLPETVTPLHWHGDVYDLPVGAKLVGSSDLTPVQGFAMMERFYGILFHLESTLEQVSTMAEMFPDEVIRGGTTPESLTSEAPDRLHRLQKPSLECCRRWADLI